MECLPIVIQVNTRIVLSLLLI